MKETREWNSLLYIIKIRISRNRRRKSNLETEEIINECNNFEKQLHYMLTNFKQYISDGKEQKQPEI